MTKKMRVTLSLRMKVILLLDTKRQLRKDSTPKESRNQENSQKLSLKLLRRIGNTKKKKDLFAINAVKSFRVVGL